VLAPHTGDYKAYHLLGYDST